MGEVIRKTAAVEDILADARTTVTRARARGGVFAESAEARLAPVLALVEPLEAELAEARRASAALVAALDAADHDADIVVRASADRIWNAIGRPARDAGFELLFPSGSGYYVDGDVEEQPHRMRLLVGLLRRGVHPRLAADVAAAVADELEQAAVRLAAAVDAARAPRTQVTLLSRTRTALGRTAALELADYKRLLRAHGVSEAAVHEVIPDRPGAHGASASRAAARPDGPIDA